MEESITSTVVLPPETVVQLSKQKRVQRINNEHFFRAHPELRAMMAAFMSALLKEKPDDVADFAEQFFTQPDLARQLGYVGWSRPETPEPEEEEEEEVEYEEDEEELDDDVGGTTGMDPVALEAMLIGLFKEADQDNSGTLDFSEFVELMATADVGLSKQDLKMLIAEADENSDGSVTYTEFVPLAVQVIQTMSLKQRAAELAEEANEELRFIAEEIVGHTADEIAQLVTAKAEGRAT